jgi:hypothetical protein
MTDTARRSAEIPCNFGPGCKRLSVWSINGTGFCRQHAEYWALQLLVHETKKIDAKGDK